MSRGLKPGVYVVRTIQFLSLILHIDILHIDLPFFLGDIASISITIKEDLCLCQAFYCLKKCSSSTPYEQIYCTCCNSLKHSLLS